MPRHMPSACTRSSVLKERSCAKVLSQNVIHMAYTACQPLLPVSVNKRPVNFYRHVCWLYRAKERHLAGQSVDVVERARRGNVNVFSSVVRMWKVVPHTNQPQVESPGNPHLCLLMVTEGSVSLAGGPARRIVKRPFQNGCLSTIEIAPVFASRLDRENFEDP